MNKRKKKETIKYKTNANRNMKKKTEIAPKQETLKPKNRNKIKN